MAETGHVKTSNSSCILGRLWFSLIGSWIFLGLVYAFWHLRSSLIIHVTGPIAASIIGSIVVAVDGLPAWIGLAEMGIRSLAAGCSVSTIISFPVTTLILLVIALKPAQRV
jgi:hypothetical protein